MRTSPIMSGTRNNHSSFRFSRRRVGAITALFLGVALAVTACGPSGTPTSTSSSTAAASALAAAKSRAKPWVVTSSGQGVVQGKASVNFTIIKMSTVIAADQMRKDGWNVTANFINADEDVVQSLVQGSSDAANIALPTVLSAVAGGAPVHVVAGTAKFGFEMVGDSSIKSAKDLNGKRIAYQSTISSGTLAARLWALGKNVKPQYLVMAGSAVRGQALIAGQLDATAVSTGQDKVIIAQGKPGQFKVLYVPLDHYPYLVDTVLAYSGSLDPQKRAFLDTFLKDEENAVNELAKNPSILAKWVKEHQVQISQDPKILSSLLFDDQQGVSASNVDKQIELMVKTGQIPNTDAVPTGKKLIDNTIWNDIKGSLSK